jgi:hypothetical protein
MNYGTATKKPVLIDWFKWEGDDFYLDEWVKSFNQKYLNHFISITDKETGRLNLFVRTLEGSSYNVPEGYIIIRGVEGEYYPCEPKIFEKTYNIMIENKK